MNQLKIIKEHDVPVGECGGVVSASQKNENCCALTPLWGKEINSLFHQELYRHQSGQ
jgi:hypothetical protein